MAIKIDGSKVRFWSTKGQAINAAKAIGWPTNSLVPVETRFCMGWALCQYGGELLSSEEYGRLYHDRNGMAA